MKSCWICEELLRTVVLSKIITSEGSNGSFQNKIGNYLQIKLSFISSYSFKACWTNIKKSVLVGIACQTGNFDLQNVSARRHQRRSRSRWNRCLKCQNNNWGKVEIFFLITKFLIHKFRSKGNLLIFQKNCKMLWVSCCVWSSESWIL